MAYSINSKCIGCTACLKICPSSAVLGEKKEPHTINPDLCIECGACGRICPAKAVEDIFGMVAKKIKKKQWPEPVIDLDLCMSCGICTETCPTGALSQSLEKKKNPHTFPVMEDESLCIGCGFCELDCPVGAITMETKVLQKDA